MNYDYAPIGYQFIELQGCIKMFAGWSYSWRLNSGVTKIVIEDTYAYVHGYSGSIYRISLKHNHVSFYAGSVLCGIVTQLNEAGEYYKLMNLEEVIDKINESN